MVLRLQGSIHKLEHLQEGLPRADVLQALLDDEQEYFVWGEENRKEDRKSKARDLQRRAKVAQETSQKRERDGDGDSPSHKKVKEDSVPA